MEATTFTPTTRRSNTPPLGETERRTSELSVGTNSTASNNKTHNSRRPSLASRKTYRSYESVVSLASSASIMTSVNRQLQSFHSAADLLRRQTMTTMGTEELDIDAKLDAYHTSRGSQRPEARNRPSITDRTKHLLSSFEENVKTQNRKRRVMVCLAVCTTAALAVLPMAGLFVAMYVYTEKIIDATDSSGPLRQEVEELARNLRIVGICLLAFFLIVSPLAGLMLGCAMVSPSELIGMIESSLTDMVRNMMLFARFLPDSLVNDIMAGSEDAARLHVEFRQVTVMFVDVKDFTSISESLSPRELLLLLTRYFSVMTHIAETYEGIVAEILGDGLLVYWNARDDVYNHSAKEILVELCEEYERLNLPQISIRIGLHAGRVLCGNIGSESKMKFGCLGDPVNLTSRLEGLCKFYETPILCSGELYDALPECDFICRELDLVQVKGKKTPTRIYEVVGNGRVVTRSSRISNLRDEVAFVPDSRLLMIDAFERALKLFQTGKFVEAAATCRTILKDCPEETATLQLLERCREYLDLDETVVVNITPEELEHFTGVRIMHDK